MASGAGGHRVLGLFIEIGEAAVLTTSAGRPGACTGIYESRVAAHVALVDATYDTEAEAADMAIRFAQDQGMLPYAIY